MDYPIEILPNPERKFVECDLSAYFLIRLTHTDDPNALIDPETGEIVLQHICSPKEHIDDLSFSLLGIYNVQHIRLGFTQVGKDKFVQPCLPNEPVEIPEYEIEFTNDEIRGYWHISIPQLHNIPFSYTRGSDSFTATCLVRHTPMRWNFWHFSLHWDTDLGPLDTLEEKKRRKVAQRIGHSARVILARHARLGMPEYPVLPENCYSNN